MRTITDRAMVRKAYEDCGLSDWFDTPDLPFFLACYEKGEIIRSPLVRTGWYQITLSGTVRIYLLREDGTLYQFTSNAGRNSIGEQESFAHTPLPLYTEAVTRVLTIALRMEECRNLLSRDQRFLNHTVQSLADLLSRTTMEDIVQEPLQTRALNHMRMRCPGGKLVGLNRAAAALHCSSRQLDRVLKELESSGLVVKTGKGTYQLTDAGKIPG